MSMNRLRRRSAQVIASLQLVVLVAVFTPCCEVFAALGAAGVPAHTDTPHSHQDDSDAPPSGEHCAPWFEQAFMPVGGAALLSPGPSGMNVPLPYQLPTTQYLRLARIVPHAGAPPSARAVYLLTSRFLL
jgi:hypothetical protein